MMINEDEAVDAILSSVGEESLSAWNALSSSLKSRNNTELMELIMRVHSRVSLHIVKQQAMICDEQEEIEKEINND